MLGPSLFSGWKRPGLIEAFRPGQSFPWLTHHFRGGNAPASLKLRVVDSEGKDRTNFRGGNAPASLKRVKQAIPADSFVLDFRGGNAPASLKRVCRALQSVRRRRFRGRNAPASLKLGFEKRASRDVDGISGE